MFYLFEVLSADLGVDVQQVFGNLRLEFKRKNLEVFVQTNSSAHQGSIYGLGREQSKQ